MSLDAGCLTDHFDIRDYTLIKALQEISRQQGEDLEYAVFKYDKNINKPEYYQGKIVFKDDGSYENFDENRHNEETAFDQYKIETFKFDAFPKKPLDSLSVIVPIRTNSLKKQVEFKLEVNHEGEIILVGERGDGEIFPAGRVIQSKGKIVVINENEKDLNKFIQGQLVISRDGKVAVVREKEEEPYLYLGAGFRKYEMKQVYWSPVERQYLLQTYQREDQSYYPDRMCAANAGVALLEYFQRVSEGRHFDASRLFLHQVACKLLNLKFNSGVSVKAVVEAMSKFGVPPEEYWPYDPKKLEEEPSAFCYALARNYRATNYLRLDRPGMDKEALITQIKIFVYSGLPVIFGFSIYDSIEQSFEDEHNGRIPFPTYGEIRLGGHAAVIVGYEDNKVIVNSNFVGDREDHRQVSEIKAYSIKSGEVVRLKKNDDSELIVTKGAFKIRNSWGKQWGEKGYGWLPYAYIRNDHAFDFWTILKFEWINRDDFGLLSKGNDLVMCNYSQCDPYP